MGDDFVKFGSHSLHIRFARFDSHGSVHTVPVRTVWTGFLIRFARFGFVERFVRFFKKGFTVSISGSVHGVHETEARFVGLQASTKTIALIRQRCGTEPATIDSFGQQQRTI